MGDTATYRDVFPGVDLEYVITRGGVKESFILVAAPEGELSWTWRVRADGAELRVTEDGAIELVTPDGEVAALIPPATMEKITHVKHFRWKRR